MIVVIPRNCLSSPGIFAHLGTEIIMLIGKLEPLQTQKLGSGSHADRRNYTQTGGSAPPVGSLCSFLWPLVALRARSLGRDVLAWSFAEDQKDRASEKSGRGRPD